MVRNKELMHYSNIKTTGITNNRLLDSSMICQKELVGHKKSGEPVYNFKLNVDFWKNIHEPISVILDEAHSIINSRRSMSQVNIVVTDWVALIRRVLGEDSRGVGDLVLITQLPQRIDVICREMATQVKYHCCHYIKFCKDCSAYWGEDTDMPEIAKRCPSCNSINLKRQNFKIEIKVFPNVMAYVAWKTIGMNTYFKHYFINDIEEYFGNFDTLQWDNLFNELYY
jgi:hypothetical protein